jgi:hypothetical protein
MYFTGDTAESNCRGGNNPYHPWRRLRRFNYLAQVITGVKFKDGIEVIAVEQVAA